jgi:hypothetical protein
MGHTFSLSVGERWNQTALRRLDALAISAALVQALATTLPFPLHHVARLDGI